MTEGLGNNELPTNAPELRRTFEPDRNFKAWMEKNVPAEDQKKFFKTAEDIYYARKLNFENLELWSKYNKIPPKSRNPFFKGIKLTEPEQAILQTPLLRKAFETLLINNKEIGNDGERRALALYQVRSYPPKDKSYLTAKLGGVTTYLIERMREGGVPLDNYAELLNDALEFQHQDFLSGEEPDIYEKYNINRSLITNLDYSLYQNRDYKPQKKDAVPAAFFAAESPFKGFEDLQPIPGMKGLYVVAKTGIPTTEQILNAIKLDHERGGILWEEDILRQEIEAARRNPKLFASFIRGIITDQVAANDPVKTIKHLQQLYESSSDRSPALDDPFLDAARKLFATEKGVSASFLQRRLEIGYNRAAQLFEFLQKEEQGQKAASETQAPASIGLPSYLLSNNEATIGILKGPSRKYTKQLNSGQLAETLEKAINYSLAEKTKKRITEVLSQPKDNRALITCKYKGLEVGFELSSKSENVRGEGNSWVNRDTLRVEHLTGGVGVDIPVELKEALLDPEKMLFTYFKDSLVPKGIALKEATLGIYQSGLVYIGFSGEPSLPPAPTRTVEKKPQDEQSLEEIFLTLFKDIPPDKQSEIKPLPGMEKLLEKRRAGQPIIEQDIIDGIETYAKSTGRPAAYNYFPNWANLQTKPNFWPSLAELVATNEKAALDSNLVGRMLESGVKLEHVQEALTKGVAMSQEAWYNIEGKYLTHPSYVFNDSFETGGSSILKHIFVLQKKLYEGDPVKLVKDLYGLYQKEENKKKFVANLDYGLKLSLGIDDFEQALTDSVIQEALLASNDLADFERRLNELAGQGTAHAATPTSGQQTAQEQPPIIVGAAISVAAEASGLEVESEESKKIKKGMERLENDLKRLDKGEIEEIIVEDIDYALGVGGGETAGLYEDSSKLGLDENKDLRASLARVLSVNKKAFADYRDILTQLGSLLEIGITRKSVEDALGNGVNMSNETTKELIEKYFYSPPIDATESRITELAKWKDEAIKNHLQYFKQRYSIIFGLYKDVHELKKAIKEALNSAENFAGGEKWLGNAEDEKKWFYNAVLLRPELKNEAETLRKASKTDEQILAELLKTEQKGTPPPI